MAGLPKTTDLLMVGINSDTHDRVRRSIEGCLIGWDIRWRLVSHFATTFEEAIIVAAARPTLDVVRISNEFSLSTMAEGCEKLGDALALHPNKPWVTFFGPRFNCFGVIFRRRRIHVHNGRIEDVVYDRREEQAKPRAHTR